MILNLIKGTSKALAALAAIAFLIWLCGYTYTVYFFPLNKEGVEFVKELPAEEIAELNAKELAADEVRGYYLDKTKISNWPGLTPRLSIKIVNYSAIALDTAKINCVVYSLKGSTPVRLAVEKPIPPKSTYMLKYREIPLVDPSELKNFNQKLNAALHEGVILGHKCVINNFF